MITQRYRSQNRIPVSNVPGSHRQPDKQKPCPEMIISFPSDQADQYTDTVYNYPASYRPEGSCHLSAESCKGCFLYDKPALPYPWSLEDNSFGTHLTTFLCITPPPRGAPSTGNLPHTVTLPRRLAFVLTKLSVVPIPKGISENHQLSADLLCAEFRSLIHDCFLFYSLQFMQIRRTPCLLFTTTT